MNRLAKLLRGRWTASLLLVGLITVAYANSFGVPFLFDDAITIQRNPSIHRLWPIGPVLFPPPKILSSGRPVLNLSFALNYAFGRERVVGYHVVNLLIHCAGAILAFGLVRGLIRKASWQSKPAASPDVMAFAVAALWALHPVNTEAVTYISQRAESLMSLFYMTVFFCTLRGSSSPRPVLWYAATVAACALGMATKEVMVTAPFLLLLFDRTFLAGSWPEIWRKRRSVYLALSLTWVLLGFLMISSQIAVRLHGESSYHQSFLYFGTECRVIVRYLKLFFWPAALVFDYGEKAFQPTLVAVSLALALIAVLLFWIVRLWRQGQSLAWAGIAFFVILLPTSSVVPIAGQPIAESRLYLTGLPIAAVFVLGLQRLLAGRSFPILGLIIGCFTIVTICRNHDYRGAAEIWADTVAKAPTNARAEDNLGLALANQPGKLSAAIYHYEQALRLNAGDAEIHNNLAVALLRGGNSAAAEQHLLTALQIKPTYADAQANLATLYASVPNRRQDAIRLYEAALANDPDLAQAHWNLAIALIGEAGHEREALAHCQLALQMAPGNAEAHNACGMVLSGLKGREMDARRQYETALHLRPDYADVHNNLGALLSQQPGEELAALKHFEAAIQLNPNAANYHFNLGLLLKRLPGRQNEALSEFRLVQKILPDFVPAQAEVDAIERAQR